MNSNSNKVQVITGFIVTIIIIGVILAIYYSTRTKKSVTGTAEEKVPNISISGANIAKKTTETYMLMTEYYDLPELSKQVKIDVTVTISDSYLINTLKIRRTNGTNIYEQDLDISNGTKTVSFEALTGENMASVHTIEVIYTTYSNTTEVIGASGTVTISEEQLSLASVEGSGTITLSVNSPGLQSDVRLTKNYVVITLGTTDIFAGKKVYFAPVTGTSKGFKIMDTDSDVITGKTFYIFEAGNKKIIGTESSETPTIKYITYTGGSISLSAKTVDFQNKLFDVSFGVAVEEKAPSKPTLDNSKINWQGSNQTGVDYGGLVWTSVGDAPWDQKYKFKCEKNGKVSEFSDVYGPVSYFNYNNPKIRVSLNGVKPCAGDSNSKLKVFDSTTDTDITSQMKSFDMLSPYDGYESVFVDDRMLDNTCRENCKAELKSRDGVYKAATQTDGNFVVYKSGVAIWATETYGAGVAPYRTIMQNDGNLVLYDGNNTVRWASGTGGYGVSPYKAVMQNDGNLVVYDANQYALWTSKNGINV